MRRVLPVGMKSDAGAVNLDDRIGEPAIECASPQLVGTSVVPPLDLDVGIRPDAGALPLGGLIQL